MLRVALTGGIGSGKSEASRIFASLGTPVIDTDVISRQLVKPGSAALTEISELFGNEFILKDGNLDRQKMRQQVFNDKKARQALENILHPRIRQEVNHQLARLNSPYAIIVIPLLLETGQQSMADRVLVIDCPESRQQERVMLRDNIDQALFEQILLSQASRQERLNIADDIIFNDADLEHLQRQVMDLHHKYLSPGMVK